MTGWSATPRIRPIVQQFGSRDQFAGGIALYYSFRMRNPF